MPATYALTRSAPTAARITAVGSALQAIAAGLVVAVLIGSIFGFAAKFDLRLCSEDRRAARAAIVRPRSHLRGARCVSSLIPTQRRRHRNDGASALNPLSR